MDSASVYLVGKRLSMEYSKPVVSIVMKERAQKRRSQYDRRKRRELMFFAIMMTVLVESLCKTERLMWTKERSSYWWDFIVGETFTESDWTTNFRMSRLSFQYLCHEIEPHIKKTNTCMRKAVGVERRVAIVLWYLATNSDYLTIGHLFGVSKATVCLAVKNVCSAIVKMLLPKYIYIPSGAELKSVVDGFSNDLGFPQCAGVIDGTHIPIAAPIDFLADYYNRKGFHSILMQGTVNHLGQFIDINVGWPWRVHDARVFVNSSLYERGEKGILFPDWKQTIGNFDVPLLVLGDPAYPLLPWLLKAYIDNGALTIDEKLFNYRLSKARVNVEHAYGRLKGRWRCLLTRNNTCIEDLPCLVAACCVLHNMCEEKNDTFDEDWIPDTQHDCSQNRTQSESQSCLSLSGKNVRCMLTTYFSR